MQKKTSITVAYTARFRAMRVSSSIQPVACMGEAGAEGLERSGHFPDVAPHLLARPDGREPRCIAVLLRAVQDRTRLKSVGGRKRGRMKYTGAAGPLASLAGASGHCAIPPDITR